MNVLYFDGGSKDGKAIYSYIIYDDEDKKNIIYSRAGRCGYGDCNMAEYRALLLGLQKCIDLNIKDIKVFGDSKNVINQVKYSFSIQNEIFQRLRIFAKDLLKNFNTYDIIWIRRCKNKEADKLIQKIIKNNWPRKNDKKKKK